MSRRLLVPLVSLLLMVAGTLVAAGWNRRDAVQRITLTERELMLPWSWTNGADDDRGELRLPINWQRAERPVDERSWLTDDALRALGFDFSTPVGDPRAERAYTRQLPRAGWLVLEYDGPAWHAVEQRRSMQTDAPYRHMVIASHLVAIDAGADRDALLRRHVDERTLIVPAIFQLGWVEPQHGGPMVYGSVQQLVVSRMTVPPRLRSVLDGLSGERPQGETAPRFEVGIAVGRLGFPWITAVRRTSSQ